VDRHRPYRNGFELYALLTRQVFDMTGNPDQEAYMTVLGPLSKTGGRLFSNDVEAKPATGSERLRGRLLEVQRRPKERPPDSAREFWKELFGTDTPDHERGRIVRISRPFEIEVKLP